MRSNQLLSTASCLFILLVLLEQVFQSDTASVDVQSAQCTLVLPYNSSIIPVVTNERTRRNLVPFEDQELRYVRFAKDHQVEINCEKGRVVEETKPYPRRLTCVQGAAFRDEAEDLVVLPDGIQCLGSKRPTLAIRKKGTCPIGGTNFDVNFVNESPPRKFYSSCVDEQTSGALYSSSYIDGKSFAEGADETSGNRPDFRGQEFYPFGIKDAYKWTNARAHLTELLGSEDIVDEYFPSQKYRFSRGHLFPNGDPIKRFEKQATFYYVNTVPQWQLLNAGNWARLEQDVRVLAKDLETTLKVVTGSYNVTTLPDENNNNVEIWLARDDEGNLQLPVPRLVWKVVHDPARSAAVAVVQVNNPWVFDPENDKVCKDVCGNLKWLKSLKAASRHSERKGYTYCCDVNELRKVIPYIPEIQYENLLEG